MGEHASLGGFEEECGIGRVQQRDHWAGGFADDLGDQFQRVFRALAQSDERDVGPLPASHRADVLDFDLTRDHLMAKGDHDRGDERKAVFALVGDQNA